MILKPFPSFHLYAIVLFLYFIQSNASSLGNETDLFTLIAIRDRIGGLSAWNRSMHFCQWQGIICGKRHKRVIQLQLSNQSLVGSIAPHIGNLSFLRVINLTSNKLYGEIPQEIGQLHRLEKLLMREYGMGGDASTAGDVYSYGILLLEILTARRPTDTIFRDGLNLRRFVEMALPSRVMDVVDPVLSAIEEGSEAERAQECIAAVLRIGMTCSSETPGERMSMEDVAKALHHIRISTFDLPQDGTTKVQLQGNKHPERLFEHRGPTPVS